MIEYDCKTFIDRLRGEYSKTDAMSNNQFLEYTSVRNLNSFYVASVYYALIIYPNLTDAIHRDRLIDALNDWSVRRQFKTAKELKNDKHRLVGVATRDIDTRLRRAERIIREKVNPVSRYLWVALNQPQNELSSKESSDAISYWATEQQDKGNLPNGKGDWEKIKAEGDSYHDWDLFRKIYEHYRPSIHLSISFLITTKLGSEFLQSKIESKEIESLNDMSLMDFFVDTRWIYEALLLSETILQEFIQREQPKAIRTLIGMNNIKTKTKNFVRFKIK